MFGRFTYKSTGRSARELSAATALLLVAASIAACDKPAPKQTRAVPVEVATATKADVPVVIQAIGTVEPVQSVSVRSQVSGVLQTVSFNEGDAVTEGQVLFQIDQRTFEAARMQAAAQLKQAEIQAQNARRDLERGDAIFKKQMISAEEHDRLRTAADAADALISVQKAALRAATLNVEYSTIKAPISGRAGHLAVHRGDLVKGNDTVLVSINQIDPISAKFSIPEKDLGNVRAAMARGEVPVTATPATVENEKITGRMSFVDNAVSTQTGSIMLKAIFANSDERLWPGQFVQVAAELGTEKDAVVIPARAVQSGQAGSFVFVIDADSKAQLRKVRTGRSSGDGIVIAEGVQVGEKVVVDGQIKLGDKTPVELKGAEPVGNSTR